mmetsp:Transcript_14338/g.16269  ORF Transcript_14338/g.16269 Transcript_14338/m.16269 type:complete len:184 (+) Transcript_14338:300-851(+)|eukprot:CAMPEP_0184039646 /NCGR_PEP_ID=MMETSP0955-20130417/53901_1 /TAXON_ID=627963 /ORGANISM="Aplanochytrium sp, Strain PBS07" /LENGTH=183 /DNA_ID=CAMNT_0026328975 /DNA_START=187 /DNA_END=738 /DNA_ORIENTATION=-
MGAGGSHEEELRAEEIAELVKLSGFRKREIEKLYLRFRKLDRGGKGFVMRAELLKIPELTMNPLCKRIMNHFGGEDKDRMNFTEFVQYLSTFNKQASRNEKAQALFEVFDRDEDGYISSKELLEILKSMVTENIEDIRLKSMVAMIIKEADVDRDGKLSFDEFRSCLDGNRLEKVLTLSPWEE